MIRTAAPERRPAGVVLDDYPASFLDGLSAAAGAAWEQSPGPSAARIFELGVAGGPVAGPVLDEFGNDVSAFQPPRTVLQPEEARSRYGHLGLTFDQPIAEGAAEILADRARTRIAREDVLRRAPQGVGSQAAQFAAGFAVSILDPVNVASAFIPVVGQARWAAWAARYGTTGARAMAGAVEGAAGAALLEPLVLGAAVQEQADYGVADSLLNIAFGSALGGGLHVGAGAVRDTLAARAVARAEAAAQGAARSLEAELAAAPPETREAFLRVALAQAAEGRPIELEPLRAWIRADAAGRAAEAEFDALFAGAGAGVPVRDIFDASPRPPGRTLADAPEARAWTVEPGEAGYALRQSDAEAVQGLARELEASSEGYRVFLEVDGQGSTPEIRGVSSTVPDWFKGMSRDERITRAEVRRVADKLAGREALTAREAKVARALVGEAREQRAAVYRSIVSERRAARQRAWQELMDYAARLGADDDPAGGLPGADRDVAGDGFDDVAAPPPARAAAAGSGSSAGGAVPAIRDSSRADQALGASDAAAAAAPDGAMDAGIAAQFAALSEAGRLTADERAAFAELDRADAQGRAVADAAEAAALCLIRGAA